MNQNYENENLYKSLDTQKRINNNKETSKASSVKKALNWLFLSEYKE